MQAYKRTKFFNQPLRLSKKQRKRPVAVIRNFYSWYHLDDIRKLLEEWFEVAITTESSQYETARDRSNLLFFYRNLELLTEAVYMIIRDELPEAFSKFEKQVNHSVE